MARPEPLTPTLEVKFGQSNAAGVVSWIALPGHIKLIGEPTFLDVKKPALNLLVPCNSSQFLAVLG